MTLFLVWMLLYPLVATGRKAIRYRFIAGYDGSQDQYQTIYDLAIYAVVALILLFDASTLIFKGLVGIALLSMVGYGVYAVGLPIYRWSAQKLRGRS